MTHGRIISTAVALVLASAMSIVGLFVTTPPSWAQEPTTYLGTLTCGLSPASEEPFGVERELSCTFEPTVGPQARLQGIVKRLGAVVSDQGQIVMVWTVFGPSADTPAAQLQGRYVGSMDMQSEGGLIGGTESSIHLKPLTGAPGFVNAAISILQLELSVMKA